MIVTLRIAAIVAIVGTLAFGAGAGAQGLPDPTRPPATLYNPAPTGGPGGLAGEPQLQSVLVSKGRRVAVIDGDTYRVGDTVKGKRVAAVGEDEVVLVQGKARQVLKLYPTAAAPQLK